MMSVAKSEKRQPHLNIDLTSPQEEAANGGYLWSSGVFWVSAYFLVNLSLTLYNKLALQAFSYPWTLTALHTGSSWIGCQLAERTGLSPRTARAGYGYRESLLLLIFSTLYTVNIAVSNISLQMVSVPLHQVIRALTPFFSISISTILLGKSYSATIWISLCTILAGVGLATSGDYSASTAGVLMTLLGALLASLKGLSTNRILVGSLRMPPLQLLKRMSPLACMQCLVLAYYSGELQGARESLYIPDTASLKLSLLGALFFNGVLAFMMNVVSFNANKKVGNLTMDVAANIKQVTTVVLAVFLFNLQLGFCNTCGILLSLVGGALYSYGNRAKAASEPKALVKPEKLSPAVAKNMDWEVQQVLVPHAREFQRYSWSGTHLPTSFVPPVSGIASRRPSALV